MKFEEKYTYENSRYCNILKRMPLTYEMLRANSIDDLIDGNTPYFFEDHNMKVWKPRDKGHIGRFEMNYNSPVGGRENYITFKGKVKTHHLFFEE